MKYMKMLCLGALVALISACSSPKEPPVEHKIVPFEGPDVIALQNLKSRVLAYCYDSSDMWAEECAVKLEQEGYVRLKDIPSSPAEFDFLKSDTYPTRRWRREDRVPRW